MSTSSGTESSKLIKSDVIFFNPPILLAIMFLNQIRCIDYKAFLILYLNFISNSSAGKFIVTAIKSSKKTA